MIAYACAAAGLTAGAALWLAGRRQATDLHLTSGELPVPGLPAPLAGLTILHLSDLHLRRRSDLTPLTALAREAAPDLVFITGDLVGGRGGTSRAVAFLQSLAGFAVYCCPGNADYAKDGRSEPDLAGWRATGVHVLVNQAEPLPGSSAWVVGVDDPHRHRDDLTAALAAVPPDAFVILLAHSPDVILRPGAQRARLVFCGHTHGGQVCLPGGFAPYTHAHVPRRYASGVNSWGQSLVVTSRGVGVTRLPVRLFCPPQATRWLLRSG